MPDLRHYRQKRDLEQTPEPAGEDTEARVLPPGAVRSFVVQQHDATRMHWDLRLEIEGVLVSWAVPRGPSLDPAQKRLAAQTEDHPLEYADFEGVIPRGNYGAGAMIVWDRGLYHTADGQSPAQGLASGKLDLVFDGHKLRGRFALIRLKGEDGRSWLLFHKGQPPGGEELVEAQPASVLSGLTVDELREGVSREAVLAKKLRRWKAPRRDVRAGELRPMLASLAQEPFSDPDWLFELKHDGARVIAEKDGERVRLWSRRGRDATGTYPELARSLLHLPVGACVLDGEVVALDERGHSSFERLQRRFTQRDPIAIARAQLENPVVYYAFDVLAACGHDLRGLPLERRKELLGALVPRVGQVRYADHVHGEGEALFELAREHGQEGIVAKRADSTYQAGERVKSWLKLKIPRSACFAVVGYLPARGGRRALGSLLLAWRRGGAFVYAGAAGSGLDEATSAALLERLNAGRLERAPCDGVPEPPPKGAVFARPEEVAEVRFTEVTGAGLLRQPVFVGLRDDVDPADCAAPEERETLEEVAPEARPTETELRIVRREKVFWPDDGYTKGDLLDYYEAAWPWIGPYLRDRPLVLTRYPDGIDGKNFFQKNAPDWTPSWVRQERIEDTDYFICNDARMLMYVINSGAIPLHVWSARRPHLDRPDWLILDLDPKQAPFAHVLEIARHIHRMLDTLDAPHYCKTSGQDGLHVLVPLGAQLDHEQAKLLGEVLARVVCAELPEIATIARPVAARGTKVYVDFLQNGRGKLIVSPLSVRPRAGAPVSMPLRWSQVTARLDPTRYTIRTAVRQLEKGGDPMLPVLTEHADVAHLLQALGERLVAAGG